MTMVSRVRSACVLTSGDVDRDEQAFHVANTLLEMQLRRHRLEIQALQEQATGAPASSARTIGSPVEVQA